MNSVVPGEVWTIHVDGVIFCAILEDWALSLDRATGARLILKVRVNGELVDI